MAVYYMMNSYDIENWEAFQQYGPNVLPLLLQYGAEVLAADTEAISLEGQAKTMNAIVKFPSREAALNCCQDPRYQEIRKIRIDSTSNCTMILVKQFSQS